jgi:hypothetical protein
VYDVIVTDFGFSDIDGGGDDSHNDGCGGNNSADLPIPQCITNMK